MDLDTPSRELELLAVVRELVRELSPQRLKRGDVTLASRLDRDLGIDSLARTELVLRIERKFRVRLPVTEVAEMETLRDLLKAVEHSAPGGMTALAPDVATHAETELIGQPDHVNTLTEMLDWHADNHPDHIHVTVLQDENVTLGTMTYGDLRAAAHAVAQGLIARDIVPGDRVAMMLPTSTDFFASFFGILYAGAVPVPIYPPARMAQLEEHMRRQIVILSNAGARMLITVPEGRALAVLLRSQVETLNSVETVATLSDTKSEQPLPPHNDPEAMGLMQYTSGSTGDPKGVMLTHRGLVENVRSMGHAMDASSADVFVELAAALPRHGADRRVARLLLFRRAALCDVADQLPGAPGHLAVDHAQIPRDVFRRAELRVRAVREPHSGRGSAGARPLGAALRRQRRRADLAADLAPLHRPLRQVRHEPRRALAELRARGELRRALLPAVRARPADRSHQARAAGAARLRRAGGAGRCGCASRWSPAGIRSRTTRCASSTTPGASSASARRACWNSAGPRSPRATSATRRRRKELFHDGWVKSGDRAYIANGDIHITGRVKDIIIRAGRNTYPHEIEEAISAIPGIRKGGVAAFGSPDPQNGTERLVVMAETKETNPEARAKLIAAAHEVVTAIAGSAADDIVLVPPRGVPKTSSGKVRRSSAKELYETGRTDVKQSGVWLQIARLAHVERRAQHVELRAARSARRSTPHGGGW